MATGYEYGQNQYGQFYYGSYNYVSFQSIITLQFSVQAGILFAVVISPVAIHSNCSVGAYFSDFLVATINFDMSVDAITVGKEFYLGSLTINNNYSVPLSASNSPPMVYFGKPWAYTIVKGPPWTPDNCIGNTAGW